MNMDFKGRKTFLTASYPNARTNKQRFLAKPKHSKNIMDQNDQYQILDYNWINQYQIFDIPIWIIILFGILWYFEITPGLKGIKNLAETHPPSDDPYLKGKRVGYVVGIFSRGLSIIIFSILTIMGFFFAKIVLTVLIVYNEIKKAKNFVSGFQAGLQERRGLRVEKNDDHGFEGKLLSLMVGLLFITIRRGIFILLIFSI